MLIEYDSAVLECYFDSVQCSRDKHNLPIGFSYFVHTYFLSTEAPKSATTCLPSFNEKIKVGVKIVMGSVMNNLKSHE